MKTQDSGFRMIDTVIVLPSSDNVEAAEMGRRSFSSNSSEMNAGRHFGVFCSSR